MADKAAKEACKRNENPEVHLLSNSKKTRGSIVKTHLTSLKSVTKPSPLPIGFTSIDNQLTTGHSSLNYHLFKIKKIYDPNCIHCHMKETTQHFFNTCVAYKASRMTLRRQAVKVKFNSNQLHLLLERPKTHGELAKFIQSTHRFPFLDHIDLAIHTY
ncbi:hypothetical protein PCANC_21666 [Puccinia coronata f. sp. avenae]|uniref:Reverse transcriptase zinc-binding domain-containing protein n=1 Tax=Puccinia coronata f. sp. avenae TaxID=200324 RepID=A0A2N5SGS0_9BASI|nr:hypothetical protein PCANC_21666 [Puccinia coronata f. sp. avenae]PLW51115.1 hypothetical protein PCASD_02431 [Puccinia coronata f. sp. avenae]